MGATFRPGLEDLDLQEGWNCQGGGGFPTRQAWTDSIPVDLLPD